uniref:Uncharacterized protein n=1 Tax=Meloidogyne enterolobii TaxID=390850 RepID=A0A6V7V9R1_MELEN|nr:unnamed protein product [Meloidogyne enterolobii]
MSEDRRIIEYEGLKYYKEEGQWYQLQMYPIEANKLPDAIKTKKPTKFDLPPEIQLDVFKCLDFTQLLSVQQTNVYFKNFIYQYDKELARKKFNKLEIFPISEGTKNRYKEHNKPPKLYDFKSEELRLWDFGMSEQTYKFFKPEPRLYEFELSKQLEKKWKSAIENSIPMFLTSTNEKTVICELERNCKGQRDLYYFQLSRFAKTIEEMKIARYFFQLLFNCTFEFSIIHVVINPQMIELLFDNDNKVPLQLHSQITELALYDELNLNFAWNHLISNEFVMFIGIESFNMEKNRDFLFNILTNGGDKFFNVGYDNNDSKLYNLIIEHIETAQDLSKMVHEIKFNEMYGHLLSSKGAKNIEDDGKTKRFQISNKHNPKIEFSVSIEKGRMRNIPTYGNNLFLTVYAKKMNKDRKIIEHEGLKYYKEKGQWYQLQMFPIEEDKVPDAIKIKSKFDLPPEICI